MSAEAPTLRFPEFSEPWQAKPFSVLLERTSDPVEAASDGTYREIGVRSHGRGLFHKEVVTGKALGNKRVFKVVPNALVLNIVFAWEQAVAMTSDGELGFIASHRFPMFLEKDGQSYLPFVKQLLLTPKGKSLLEIASPGGAGRNKTLGQDAFMKLKAIVPERDEQKKISEFVEAVSRKITLLAEKKAALVEYKRGVMQRLFTRALRFTQDDGSAFPDWEERKLGDVLPRVRRKNDELCGNVLTISAQEGLVSQTDYFNKSVAGKDLSGYYLLRRGDFAYNKSYSKGYPMGAIKRLNKYDQGIVSSLYICFATEDETEARFYEQYFESGEMNHALSRITQEGARNHGLLNIAVGDFFNQLNLPHPHPDEQRKISDFLSAIDAKIAAVSTQISEMETFKKGLLQKMFV